MDGTVTANAHRAAIRNQIEVCERKLKARRGKSAFVQNVPKIEERIAQLKRKLEWLDDNEK